MLLMGLYRDCGDLNSLDAIQAKLMLVMHEHVSQNTMLLLAIHLLAQLPTLCLTLHRHLFQRVVFAGYGLDSLDN